jgi:hypothetical protein
MIFSHSSASIDPPPPGVSDSTCCLTCSHHCLPPTYYRNPSLRMTGKIEELEQNREEEIQKELK